MQHCLHFFLFFLTFSFVQVQGTNNDGSAADRDYAIEAVEYFKNKLRYVTRCKSSIDSMGPQRSENVQTFCYFS